MAKTPANNTRETSEVSPTLNRSPYLMWLIWVLWLPLCFPTVIQFFQSHPTPLVLVMTVIAVLLFFGTYLWSSWKRALGLVTMPSDIKHVTPWTWLAIIVLNVLNLGLALLGGALWQTLFFYTSGYVGGSLPLRWATIVASVMVLLAIIIGWTSDLGWINFVQVIVFIPVIIFITRSVIWSITTSWELGIAREEIARLAVVTERLRIARDLHDLLGHNLSLITIKSELAGRLITVAPERATIEISDVENVARTTLQEVREAVSNYRQPSLSSELHAAREILAAAGIICQFENDEDGMKTVPTTIEIVLAWTVREGVTNIIRHSRAHQCTIHLIQERQTASVKIIDDGTGSPSVSTNSTSNGGNGLRGLAERVNALGGQFHAGPYPGGGFQLTVSVPLTHKTLRSGTSIKPAQDLDSIKERS